MQKKKNTQMRFKTTVQSTQPSWWSSLDFSEKLAVPFVAVLLGMFGYNYFAAPDVKRPIYSSKEDCLADWANTPQDCEEDRSSSGGSYGRRWYGPWMDNQGTAYHENGTRSQHASNSIHSSSFSSSSRLGFGSSSGHAGG